LASICKFSISSFCGIVNRSANFQIITAPALSPHAKIFALKKQAEYYFKYIHQNLISYVLWLNSKQIIDDRLSDDGNSCTGIDDRRPVGVPSCGSRS